MEESCHRCCPMTASQARRRGRAARGDLARRRSSRRPSGCSPSAASTRTTLDAIAAEVGVGRRTLFRYFASKNDIPWGQFDRTLDGFREILAGDSRTTCPLHEAVHAAVLAFNEFPADAQPPHRERMRLILETPALQAHSVLRYAEWRGVIAEYVAAPARPGARRPAARARSATSSLALALSAYERVAGLARSLAGRAAGSGDDRAGRAPSFLDS